MKTPFDVWRQYLVPQRLLSMIYGQLSHCQWAWFKNWAIKRFIRLYGIDVTEAIEKNPEAYPSFHDFFIRHLDPQKRPCDPLANGIVSPCDGTISQIGDIKAGTLIQAKGRTYSLSELMGDHPFQSTFENGRFATLYLAPKDYHRVHMPYTGEALFSRYVPGKLFSVNQSTTKHVPNLFARNERVICSFKGEHGAFAVIMVGAMIVGSISTHMNGTLTSPRQNQILHIDYPTLPNQHIKLDKGEEMGYFSLGSTVILLFTENLSWEKELSQQTRIIVGQRIGHYSL